MDIGWGEEEKGEKDEAEVFGVSYLLILGIKDWKRFD
jgi:hypothetical protein